MLVIILGAIAAIAFIYYYVVKPLNFWKKRGVPQGKPRWVFGHGFGTFTHTESWKDLMERVYYQSPGARYTGMYHLNYPLLVIRDLDLIKLMTIKDFNHFTDHMPFLPPDSDPLFSKNLFGLRGQKWREMRTLLSPCFTSSKMRFMFGLINESAENFAQYFRKKDEDFIEVEMKNTFSRFCNDVIATTACGIKVNSLAEPNNEFYLMGQKSIDFDSIWKNVTFLLYRIFPPIKKVIKIQLFSDEVTHFFRNLIDETIGMREKKGIVRPDMIHLLLETRKGVEANEETNDIDTGFATAQESPTNQAKTKTNYHLTNEDITAQALIFFIAGFDSTSSVMCFTMHELAVNQDVQERLRKEIRSTWEECGGKLTYEALLKMKYMDMVISESLRKWPINVAVDRVCTKPYTIDPALPGEKPIHLEVGEVVWLPVFPIHRDPDYYPNPEKFDPERFSEENKDDIKPYSYLPFALGPRNCIGSRFALMMTKAVIFHVLLDFEVAPVEKTAIPVKISKKNFALHSEGGFWLGLKRNKGE